MKKPLNLRVSERVLLQDPFYTKYTLHGGAEGLCTSENTYIYIILKKTQFLLHQKGYRNEIKRKLKSNQNTTHHEKSVLSISVFFLLISRIVSNFS